MSSEGGGRREGSRETLTHGDLTERPDGSEATGRTERRGGGAVRRGCTSRIAEKGVESCAGRGRRGRSRGRGVGKGEDRDRDSKRQRRKEQGEGRGNRGEKGVGVGGGRERERRRQKERSIDRRWTHREKSGGLAWETPAAARAMRPVAGV